MTDYSYLHEDEDWIEAILPDEDPDYVNVVVKTPEGKKAITRVARRPLLEERRGKGGVDK